MVILKNHQLNSAEQFLEVEAAGTENRHKPRHSQSWLQGNYLTARHRKMFCQAPAQVHSISLLFVLILIQNQDDCQFSYYSTVFKSLTLKWIGACNAPKTKSLTKYFATNNIWQNLHFLLQVVCDLVKFYIQMVINFLSPSHTLAIPLLIQIERECPHFCTSVPFSYLRLSLICEDKCIRGIRSKFNSTLPLKFPVSVSSCSWGESAHPWHWDCDTDMKTWSQSQHPSPRLCILVRVELDEFSCMWTVTLLHYDPVREWYWH